MYYQLPLEHNIIGFMPAVRINRNFGVKVSIALAISYLGFASNLITSIMTARLLGVEGKGLFSLFIVSVSMISVFSGLGIGHGQMYYASRSPEKIRSFMPNAIVISIVFGGGSALLFFIFGKMFSLKIVDSLGEPVLLLVVIVAPILSMLTFQRQFFLATHSYKLSKLNFFLSQAIPLVLYFFLYIGRYVSVSHMIVAYVVSQYICFLSFQIWIQRRVSSKCEFSLPFAKKSISFGIRQYLSDLVNYLTSRLDFFIVAFFLGQAGLGIYSVSVALAEVIARLPSELGTILFPAFASGKVSRDNTITIVRKTLFVAITVAMILAVLGKPITLFLFGDQFSSSVALLYMLLPGVVGLSTIYITWNCISAGGRPGLGIPIFGSAALLDVISNAILLPRIGILGAGISATLSYLLAAGLFLFVFCRQLKCSLSEVIIIKSSDISSMFSLPGDIYKACKTKVSFL